MKILLDYNTGNIIWKDKNSCVLFYTPMNQDEIKKYVLNERG